MDQGQLIVNGAALLGAPTPAHALALHAAMTTDLEIVGPVVLPRNEDATHEAVAHWEAAFAHWRDDVWQRVQTMLPGAARASRREAVLASLERQADVLAGVLR